MKVTNSSFNKGNIAVLASTDPNNNASVSSLAPPFSTTSANTPLRPFVFNAVALKSIPSFSAAFAASLVGFCIEAITCRSPAKVDSTGTPVAVTVDIAALSSSIPTPAPAAIGASRPICWAY